MQKAKRVVIVSNRLPVTAEKRAGGLRLRKSTGGLATGLERVHKSWGSLWVGWPGVPLEELRDSEVWSLTDALVREGYYPVFLSEKDVEEYYEGFCNKTLWPLFHYFTERAVYDPSYWSAYKRVNERFAKVVASVARPGDVLWVHDYHLMLVPRLLRERLPSASIGFFLHIPFPSSEVFMYLPWREELLEGVLGADLVGFHTYDYVRHFLSSVRRLLGYEHAMNRVVVGGRVVLVDAFPMGVDFEYVHSKASSPEVEKIVGELRERLKGRKVVLSVDRLDYTKGVPNRLKAFEELLRRRPDYRGRVVLVLVVSPSRLSVEDYANLKREIDELVGRVNGQFGTVDWSPVMYVSRFVPDEELYALYRVADVALVTPLRDGMNLVSKEYVAAKQPGDRGVLVISETAGAAAELVEALKVNPYDVESISRALEAALEMPAEEQARRLKALQERVRRYDVMRWARDFLEKLEAAKRLQEEFASKRVTDEVAEEIASRYASSRRRLLLLDYDGTLVPLRERPEEAEPDPELLDLLRKLGSCESTKVVVISGRDRKTLERWLGSLPVTLIAEHGAWIKRGPESSWESLVEVPGAEWKREVRSILELFVDRTPGSFVEEKEYSLAWHYRRAPPELGGTRARELKETLAELVRGMGLVVAEGDKVIEVRVAGVDKGRAAARLLREEEWDFILACGDDWADEDMFAALPPSAYTIKVGVKPTRARFVVEGPGELRRLLQRLAEAC